VSIIFPVEVIPGTVIEEVPLGRAPGKFITPETLVLIGVPVLFM
jgi:hypothetical protein